jgi:hypothetical protein
MCLIALVLSGFRSLKNKEPVAGNTDVSPAPSLSAQHDKFVWQAQRGEGIMQQKSETMDAIGILSGFLTAFMLNVVLDLDPSSFNNKGLFLVYAAVVSVSVAAGLSNLLVMVTVSAKIHRLLGRSHLYYGGACDGDAIRAHGCQYEAAESWEKEKYFNYWLDTNKPGSGRRPPARLYAYTWYTTGFEKDPKLGDAKDRVKSIMDGGFQAFQILIAAVIAATVTKCIDALGTDTSGLVISLCNSIALAAAPIYTWVQLRRCGAMKDLF